MQKLSTIKANVVFRQHSCCSRVGNSGRSSFRRVDIFTVLWNDCCWRQEGAAYRRKFNVHATLSVAQCRGRGSWTRAGELKLRNYERMVQVGHIYDVKTEEGS